MRGSLRILIYLADFHAVADDGLCWIGPQKQHLGNNRLSFVLTVQPLCTLWPEELNSRSRCLGDVQSIPFAIPAVI